MEASSYSALNDLVRIRYYGNGIPVYNAAYQTFIEHVGISIYHLLEDN